MPWIDPKTDWQSTGDYYNATDLNRVELNTTYLATLPDVFRYPLVLESAITDRTAISFEFAPSLNRVERNIDRLRAALYTPIGWEAVRTDWAPMRQAFGYQDANRLEGNLTKLYQLARAILAEMTSCGTFSCGEELIL